MRLGGTRTRIPTTRKRPRNDSRKSAKPTKSFQIVTKKLSFFYSTYLEEFPWHLFKPQLIQLSLLSISVLGIISSSSIVHKFKTNQPSTSENKQHTSNFFDWEQAGVNVNYTYTYTYTPEYFSTAEQEYDYSASYRDYFAYTNSNTTANDQNHMPDGTDYNYANTYQDYFSSDTAHLFSKPGTSYSKTYSSEFRKEPTTTSGKQFRFKGGEQ